MKTQLSTPTSQPQTSTDYTSSSPPSSSQSTFSDWKPAPTSSSSTATTFSTVDTVVPKTEPDTASTNNYVDIAGQVESLEQPDIKPIADAMVPSQTQAPPQPVYSSAYYTSSEFAQPKSLPTQFNSTQYMAQGAYAGSHHPYAPATQPAIHRRPSLMVGQQKSHAYPHSPPDSRSRVDYPSQLTADNTHQPALDLSHSPVQPGLQDSHGRHGSLDSAAHHHLPPLTETLQRIDHGSPRSRPQPSTTNIDGSFYPQVPLPGAPPAVGSNVPVNQAYSRRVTYPFVPSIDTSSGLLMNSLTSPENSGSSPLLGSPFAHSSVVSANAVSSVHGMVRSSPLIGYMDAMSLHSSSQPHPATQMSPHNGAYPPSFQQVAGAQHQPQGAGWFPDASGLDGIDNGQGGNKIYSFVPISGVNSKKRPRRRFDEIERLYVCNWADCEKSYGTLNHLNAHVTMQKHGPKRNPAEFKELRKAWRRQKKAEEEAAKQAAAFQSQHNQHQQQGAQLQICDPVMSNLHPHSLAMQAMSQQQHQQHQPHQLPHPHEHPNQYQPTHHHQHQQQPQHHAHGQAQQLQHPHPHQHHHHPMGF
ncbi:hypothetical protein EC991_002304 [Linnemannia zychae]|nr:hypothetical protein EC991_002304 [Linnemannia zychae]